MSIKRTASLVLVGLFASASFAQAPAPRDSQLVSQDDIVVEGRAAQSLASEYVDRVLPIAKESQFGRFEDPICPLVVGITETAKREVADRMAQVGSAVNVDVQRQPCTPNLFLMVVPEKHAAIENLRGSRPEYLKGISKSYLEESRTSPSPYMAWQMIELYTSDGLPIVGSNSMPTASNGAQEVQGNTPQGESYQELNTPRVRTTNTPSRLRANVKPHVMAAVVLVEARALNNLDTRQLADFALMKAMMPMNDRDDVPPASSILSVFANIPVSDSAPQSLTRSDVAFLKALRSVRSDTFSAIQKSAIRGQMINELRRPSGGAN